MTTFLGSFRSLEERRHSRQITPVISYPSDITPAQDIDTPSAEELKSYASFENILFPLRGHFSNFFRYGIDKSLRAVVAKIFLNLGFENEKVMTFFTKHAHLQEVSAKKSFCEEEGFSLVKIQAQVSTVIKSKNAAESCSRIALSLFLLLTHYSQFLDKKTGSLLLLAQFAKPETKLRRDIYYCSVDENEAHALTQTDITLNEALGFYFIRYITGEHNIQAESALKVTAAFFNVEKIGNDLDKDLKELLPNCVDPAIIKDISAIFIKKAYLNLSCTKNIVFKSLSLLPTLTEQAYPALPDVTQGSDLIFRSFAIWTKFFTAFKEEFRPYSDDINFALQSELTVARDKVAKQNKSVLSQQKQFTKDFMKGCSVVAVYKELASKIDSFMRTVRTREKCLLEAVEQTKKKPGFSVLFQLAFCENLQKVLEQLDSFKAFLVRFKKEAAEDKRNSQIERYLELEPDQTNEIAVLISYTETMQLIGSFLLAHFENDTILQEPIEPMATESPTPESRRRRQKQRIIETIEAMEEQYPEELGCFEEASQSLPPPSLPPTVNLLDERRQALFTEVASLASAPLETLAAYVATERELVVQKTVQKHPSMTPFANSALTESHDHLVMAALGFELFVNTLRQTDYRLARLALRDCLLDLSLALEQDLVVKKAHIGIETKSSHHSLLKLAFEAKIKPHTLYELFDKAHLALRYTQEYRPLDGSGKLPPSLQWLDDFDLLSANPQEAQAVLRKLLPPIFECFGTTCQLLGYDPDLASALKDMLKPLLTVTAPTPSRKKSHVLEKLQHYLIENADGLKSKYAQEDPTTFLREAHDYLEMVDAGAKLKEKYPQAKYAFFHLRNEAKIERAIRAFLKAAAVCHGLGIVTGHHYNHFIKRLEDHHFTPFSTAEKGLLLTSYLGIGHHYFYLPSKATYTAAKTRSLQDILGFESDRRNKKSSGLDPYSQSLKKIQTLAHEIVTSRLDAFCKI